MCLRLSVIFSFVSCNTSQIVTFLYLLYFDVSILWLASWTISFANDPIEQRTIYKILALLCKAFRVLFNLLCHESSIVITNNVNKQCVCVFFSSVFCSKFGFSSRFAFCIAIPPAQIFCLGSSIINMSLWNSDFWLIADNFEWRKYCFWCSFWCTDKSENSTNSRRGIIVIKQVC